MLGTMVTLFAAGLVALILVGIVLSVVGAVFSLTLGLAGFLLFKVAPVVLLGWVALKLLERVRSGGTGGLTAADRRWLDGG